MRRLYRWMCAKGDHNLVTLIRGRVDINVTKFVSLNNVVTVISGEGWDLIVWRRSQLRGSIINVVPLISTIKGTHF